MTGEKKEMVVVEPMSPDAAKAQFMEWRSQHPEIASRLGQQDLILDVIRGHDGKTLHRYRIFVYDDDVANQSAASNGGPATQPGNSDLTEGPPSVS